MNFSAEGLRVELQAMGQADPEEGWALVLVLVSVPGFSGEFHASLQVLDLTRFADDCSQMHRVVGTPAEATLASAEPGIRIVLRSTARGHVTGEYSFESQRIEGVPTALTGRFESDQAGLPALERTVRLLAKELTECT